MAATGRAGKPDELFDVRPEVGKYWSKRLGIAEPADYFDKIVAATSTSNGVFGTKLHWSARGGLEEALCHSLAAHFADARQRPLDELLRAKFGQVRYLWLRRKNKVAQGISHFRASRTQRWAIRTGEARRDTPQSNDLDFDFTVIDRCVRSAEKFDREWLTYFRQHRLSPVILVYEDFVANYDRTIRGVLQFLGIAHEDLPTLEPPLQRVADERSRQWEQRYRALKAAQTERPLPQKTRGDAPRKREETRGQSSEPALPLIAYALHPHVAMRLATATTRRDWMDRNRFAYRCLPMVIANQAGWLILNSVKVAARWNGGSGLDAIAIETPPDAPAGHAVSHFGGGILTFTIPYLFRTPPGFNLYVRGPANSPKDGVYALEGIVETDWSESSFTMNWKITRPEHSVIFEADEPICMISPVRRGEIENFRPEIRLLSDDPETEAGYINWARSRGKFNAELRVENSPARKQGWQRHYVKGTTVSEKRAEGHQTALALADFIDRRGIAAADTLSQAPTAQGTSSDAAESTQSRPQGSVSPQREDGGQAVEVPGQRATPTPGIIVLPDFFAQAEELRHAFDEHFATPYRQGAAHRVWNYWYVPELYTYLRAVPEQVIAAPLIEAFMARLAAWSREALGCKPSRPYLSLYINGCRQELHNDALNGRYAYVYSLTRWRERNFSGGETLLLRPAAYDSSLAGDRPMAGPSFFEMVPPEFNQLLVFDDRIPHAVRPIMGGMNPREGRVVLHGHFTAL